MTRGKYGAKAANRLAQLDNDIINGLRAELAAIKNERDVARLELEQFQRDAHAEAQRIAADMSRDALRELINRNVPRPGRSSRRARESRARLIAEFARQGGRLPS
jgi:hypothetical protein